MDMIDENSPPIRCSKPGCKRFAGRGHKRCDPCRNRQAGLVQKGRLRQKAAVTASTTDASKGRKRAREEEPSEEEQPSRQARSHSPGLVHISWRRIKHDFLHHFHMPRCDLLVWILVTKLAPTYYRKLDLLLKEQARYRELSSWRKPFKKICPAFVISRFLLCKHLIQRVHPVPSVFFLEAERFREAPFWRHKTLTPLEEYRGDSTVVAMLPT